MTRLSPVALTYDPDMLLLAAWLVLLVLALVVLVVVVWWGRAPARRHPWGPRDAQRALWRAVRRRHERF
jgi:hypothetical protein